MKPLPHKTRKKLFWGLFIVFLIITPFILAKSFGYKLDKIDDIFKITQTGGIFIQSNINNARIYLNDKYYESNGLLIRNTLIQKLIPDEEYKIVIQKDGLHDWRKVLKVYPSVVTEARVLMLPINIPKREITDLQYLINIGFIEDVSLATTTDSLEKINSETAKLQQNKKTILDKKEEGLDISATSTEKTEKQIPEFFTRLGVSDPDSLKNLLYAGDQVAWIENGNVVVSLMDTRKTPPFYYCLEWNDCRNQIIVDWSDEILAFDFLSGRDDVLIVLVKEGLYAVEIDDRSERNIQPIYLGENIKFIKDRGQIIVSDAGKYYRLEF
ncbi:MAG TPA: hypothetical protein PJ997_01880 [Candidatus Paceibacterota bacterium]|nr:hypothetical protein [Candidatus Paceibacterota bacterium]HMP19065.1 hypothetical protein [Candidatus Paceibacterota bacterium]HMP85521.1 hypothetical protein [Candidatus Paceibacterota bacterium]